ncbi:trypsin-like peptidase domain-containing protein [Archangium sp.]|uniref:trypsin-like peptidase domain-containing protein n=1 Tax=Archangium sp. TaxID=1872627 RepID=UPI002D3D0E16|nr:trypsin-like peptidase domain-containing protein [Archangium sp.]HYO53815.1 trypsin-like peptidase domain-containing protein [Archangium sp.]
MTQMILTPAWRLLVCLALMLAAEVHAQDQQFQEHIDKALARALPAVVQIHAGDGLGTGFLVSDSLVVTNHHVIEGNEEEAIGILLHDGRVTTARAVHHEEHPDIAVLKLEEQLNDMPRGLMFADMQKVRPGLLVLSIGHPGGLENSISLGILSAVGRPGGHLNEYFLQTDAAINSGNSGGPLVNLKGEVVGISTAKLRSIGGQQMDRIGFALAGNIAERIVRDIQQRGRVLRPDLAIQELSEVTGPQAIEQDVPHGALRLRIAPGGMASVAGLRDGDVLTAIAGQPVRGIHSFWVSLHRQEIGSRVKLSITREGKRLELVLPLLPLPANDPWSDIGAEFSKDLQVYGVRENSPFALSGLRPGDALVRIRAGASKLYQDIHTLDELRHFIQQGFTQGLSLRLMVKRQGQIVELKPIDFTSLRNR